MPRMSLMVVALLAVGVVGIATLTLDVDIRLKDSRAQAAPSAGAWSPTQPYPTREVYYPGTEALAPDEMRVIACGSGMPMPRLKQAAACMLVELGNGDATSSSSTWGPALWSGSTPSAFRWTSSTRSS